MTTFPYTQDPLYRQYADVAPAEFRPLGGGPTGGSGRGPRMKTKGDARSLGYMDPRITIDMQISRREGDPEQPVRGPRDQATKEGS